VSTECTSTRPHDGPLADSDNPGCIDFTPAPVVIVVDPCTQEITPDAGARRKARAARNTPAEPVASVRVRERAAERAAAAPPASQRHRAGDVCDDRIVTVTDLQPAAQYFPPMRPPESAHGHVATQPKVQVVPDCDTRLRTARSLRRLSSLPPGTSRGLGLLQTWPLYLLVAAVACVIALALVRGLTEIGSNRTRKEPPNSAEKRTPHHPSALPSVEPPQSPRDAGAVLGSSSPSAQTPRKPAPESSAPKKSVAPRPSPSATKSSTDVTVF
jgi:hypothetical protein